ncbi:MAG: cardiolipin synthase ClsB [Rhodocyclaceae bacterium]|nr:cardiolipin synthase ClsB [Rhodocyclaceae bacterium]
MTPRFLPGNRLTLLETGNDYFPALLAAINSARREIHLETYIFADDGTGRQVADALGAAAQRGVAVRVVVDGFGAREFPDGLGAGLRAQGVEVMVFRPELARLRFRRNRLRRLHRKLTVIDGRMAFVGGINIIDDWDMGDTPAQMPPRYDYAVRVEGPLLAPIHASALHLWRLLRWASLRRRPPFPALTPVLNETAGPASAAFVIRDNLRHRRDIEEVYLGAIAAAQDDILIANAYFLPGRRFRRALAAAARRGVTVTVLLQGRVEYALLHHATQALYGNLLGAGIRIFEYHRSFLHAKVAVVDADWATVGSSNIDPFSLMLAREANLVARDEAFTGQLRTSLHKAMNSGAHEIDRGTWQRAPLPQRVMRWLAYGLVRFLIGISGYGGRDYRE